MPSRMIYLLKLSVDSSEQRVHLSLKKKRRRRRATAQIHGSFSSIYAETTVHKCSWKIDMVKMLHCEREKTEIHKKMKSILWTALGKHIKSKSQHDTSEKITFTVWKCGKRKWLGWICILTHTSFVGWRPGKQYFLSACDQPQSPSACEGNLISTNPRILWLSHVRWNR